MNLQTYLLTNGLKQAEFADRIGETQPAVSRYATGRRKPSLDTIMRIQQVTKGDVRAEDFFTPDTGRRPHIRAGAPASRARASR